MRLLVLFLAILVPACASSSLAFLMMYAAYKLNKQGIINNLDLILSLFVHCSMFDSDYWFLTCIQVSQEARKVVWHSHLFKNFPQFVVIHTVKGFSISMEKLDVFTEFLCFFYDPIDVGNLISGSSAFSKSSRTSGSSWIIYCWCLTWRIFWALCC